MRRSAISLLLAATAALAACGDGPDAPPTETPTALTPAANASASSTRAGTPTAIVARPTPRTLAELDPCSVVSRTEATGLMGRPMGDAQRYNFPAKSGWADCVFPATSGQARLVVSISNTTVEARDLTDSLRSVQGGGEPEATSGLGDIAFTNGRAIAVKKGERGIQVLAFPAPADGSAYRRFVEMLVARLP